MFTGSNSLLHGLLFDLAANVVIGRVTAELINLSQYHRLRLIVSRHLFATIIHECPICESVPLSSVRQSIFNSIFKRSLLATSPLFLSLAATENTIEEDFQALLRALFQLRNALFFVLAAPEGTCDRLVARLCAAEPRGYLPPGEAHRPDKEANRNDGYESRKDVIVGLVVATDTIIPRLLHIFRREIIVSVWIPHGQTDHSTDEKFEEDLICESMRQIVPATFEIVIPDTLF